MEGIPKKERLIDLGVILCLGFLPPFAKSLYAWIYGAPHFSDPSYRNFSFFYASLWQITVLVALLRLLYRRKNLPSDIGVTFRASDIAFALAVTAAAYLAHAIYVTSSSFVYFIATGNSLDIVQQNVEFATEGLSLLLFVYILVNACFEELLFRGFVMTETELLTGSKSAAVVTSTLLQTACHLYQGLYSMAGVAVIFLVFSLTYAKSRRLTPIIISHILIDIASVVIFQFMK